VIIVQSILSSICEQFTKVVAVYSSSLFKTLSLSRELSELFNALLNAVFRIVYIS